MGYLRNLDMTTNRLRRQPRLPRQPISPQRLSTLLAVENYQNNLTTRNQGRNDININLNTSEASANEFKRDVINEPDGMTRIVGSGGQLFYGRTGSKETVKAIKASESKVKKVKEQRSANANHWNVNAGVKPVAEFTQTDKEMVVNMGKATVN
jgi:hypothetical protein